MRSTITLDTKYIVSLDYNLKIDKLINRLSKFTINTLIEGEITTIS
jgi:hypothetical protein